LTWLCAFVILITLIIIRKAKSFVILITLIKGKLNVYIII